MLKDQLKVISSQHNIPLELYPDFELYEPILKMIVDECCEIAIASGKPIIAKRIRERLFGDKE